MLEIDNIERIMKNVLLLLLLVASLFLVACSNEKNKAEDFKITTNYTLYNEDIRTWQPYENQIKGQIKNISDEKKENIKVKFKLKVKDEIIIDLGTLTVKSLESGESYDYIHDIKDIYQTELKKHDVKADDKIEEIIEVS